MEVKGNLNIDGTLTVNDAPVTGSGAIIVTDGIVTKSNVSTLRFSDTDFYLDGSSPTVNLRNPSAAASTSSDPGFYGVNFRETDGSPVFRNDTIYFDSSAFYLHPNSVGKPVLSFRDPRTPGSGITAVVQDTAPSLGGNLDTNGFTITGTNVLLNANGGQIDLTSSGVLTVNAPSISVNNVNIVDVADPVTAQDAATKAYVDAQSGGSSPGFYGIVFRESDGNPPAFRNDTIIFDSQNFYLYANSVLKPSVSLRNINLLNFTDGLSTYLNKPVLNFSNSNFYLSGSSSSLGPTVNLRNLITKALVVEFPAASENVMIFRAHEAMRLGQVRVAVVGSSTPSVTVSIQSGSDRSTLGTTHVSATAVTNTTTGAILTVSTPTIAAGSWVCLVTTAQSGTVTELDVNLTLEYI